MKEKTLKIITIITALVLALCMCTAVFAEDEEPETGSITIKGTKTGMTYDIYKIFDLTYKKTTVEDVTTTNVSYTIDPTWAPFFATGASGAGYIVDTETVTVGTGDDAVTYTLNPIIVHNSTSGEDEIKYINITEANVAEFAQDALDYAEDHADASDAITPDTSASGTGSDVVVDELELGYYLVYPKGASVLLSGAASLCSLDSTIPDAEITPKSELPTITKTVDDPNADVGQVVTFTVEGVVPDTTAFTSYEYTVSDHMTEGLTFDSTVANMSVKFINEKTDPDTETPVTVNPTYENNGFTFTLDMTNYQDYKGQKIVITYQAVVNEGAVNDVENNSVTLTYSNDPDNPNSKATTPAIERDVWSSEITLTKIDAADKNKPLAEAKKLAGAKFVLTKQVPGATAGTTVTKYYKAYSEHTIAGDTSNVAINNASTTAGVVKVEWVDNIADATVLVTDANGLAVFEGIENGLYYLVETEAPEGYNKLTEPIPVKVGYTNETETTLVSQGVNKEVTVLNNSGNELPETGGLGTKLFIIVGSIVAMGAAIVLVTNKRMSKESL